LFLSESCSKDPATSEHIDLLDPMAGEMSSIHLETFAKELGNRGDSTMHLIDADKIKQVIQVCFDCSTSMGWSMEGYFLGEGSAEPTRMAIATQFLTTFANRTYGYRVPCIQGLLAFPSRLSVKCPLSPLIPDFEDGIRKLIPSGSANLWDALKKATDDLIEFVRPNGIDQFPNASLRILVISDGEDVGSTATALEVVQSMWTARIVCDSIAISMRDECKSLCAISHVTGAVSFRPSSIYEGLELFEHEAFLCYDQRRKPPQFRGPLNEEIIAERAASDSFDTKVEASITITATMNQPIATPRYIIAQNQSREISDARRRRILRELHQAAAVQQIRAIDENRVGEKFHSTILTFEFIALEKNSTIGVCTLKV
jgi:hypothetical protein